MSKQHSMTEAKTIRRVLMGEWAKNDSRLKALAALDSLEEQLRSAELKHQAAEEDFHNARLMYEDLLRETI